MSSLNQNGIQINKYISNSGFCSRREADKLIEQGRVTINGKIALVTNRVSENDRVAIDDERIKTVKKEHVYLAFNKPVGITCTTDEKDKTNIISFINYPKRIFPIGRLDKDSEGLILLTDDGDIVNKVLRSENENEKEYVVVVDKEITEDFLLQMKSGVPVLDTVTKPCKIKKESNKKFRITLTQGLNRQIRRMCHQLGYEVTSLRRVRIMHIQLGDLKIAKWRKLLPAEIDKLNQLIKHQTAAPIKSKPINPKTQKPFFYPKNKGIKKATRK